MKFILIIFICLFISFAHSASLTSNLPIGTYLESDLTESQFQSLMGRGWVLADGRSVVGSAYANLTGKTNAPDARGIFLRGKNNGRSDGKQNPDGEISLGAYTFDKFSSHNHQERFMNGTAIQDAFIVTTIGTFPQLMGTQGSSGAGTAGPLNTNNSGGNETSPKNITVNIFIRIN